MAGFGGDYAWLPKFLSGDFGSSVTASLANKEAHLESAIRQLKADIDGCGDGTSSVQYPSDASVFGERRTCSLKTLLQIPKGIPSQPQASKLLAEFESAIHHLDPLKLIPVLLLQHYEREADTLRNMSKAHMIRWSRYSETVGEGADNFYATFKQRMMGLREQLEDCVERRRRLSVVVENVRLKKKTPLKLLNADDVSVYLRSYVSNLHLNKRINQFVRSLQWLPMSQTEQFTKSGTAWKLAESEGVQLNSETVKEGWVPTPPPILSTSHILSNRKAATPFLRLPPPPVSEKDIQGELLKHVSSFNSIQPDLIILSKLMEIPYPVEDIQTSGEEMELYSVILRRFQEIFHGQELLTTFRTYKIDQIGAEGELSPSEEQILLGPADIWLKDTAIYPCLDRIQMKQRALLRERLEGVDEILSSMYSVVKLKDSKKFLSFVKSASTQSLKDCSSSQRNHMAMEIAQVWASIYNGLQTLNRDQGEGSDRANEDEDDDSKEYSQNVQMLGLNEEGEQHQQPTRDEKRSGQTKVKGRDGEKSGGQHSISSGGQGGYLSYSILRYLRLRTLRLTCLNLLNYFRSVWKSVTIRERQAHVSNHSDLKLGETAPLPVLSDAKDRDDFYCYHQGACRVRDPTGKLVMYDLSLQDLKELEEEILMTLTYFIQKGSCEEGGGKDCRTEEVPSDMGKYTNLDVDRLGLLLQMWTASATFLENLKSVVDCYLLALQNVAEKEAIRRISQSLVNLLVKRPRFDLASPGFLESSHVENYSLRLHAKLLKSIIESEVTQGREYSNKVYSSLEEEEQRFDGLPLPVIAKHAINLVTNRSNTKPLYLLEFHPHLGGLADLGPAQTFIIQEMERMIRPTSVTQQLKLEAKVIETLLSHWSTLPQIGHAFDGNVQRNVLSETYLESPVMICSVFTECLRRKKGTSPDKDVLLEVAHKVLQTVDIHHRLRETIWDTESLSKLYRTQSSELSFDDCHQFLRQREFEFAQASDTSSSLPAQPPPLVIVEEELNLDRFVPIKLPLAVMELDAKIMYALCVRDQAGMIQLIETPKLDDLRVILSLQLSQRNGLLLACQQVHYTRMYDVTTRGLEERLICRPSSPSDSKSEQSYPASNHSSGNNAAPTNHSSGNNQTQQTPEIARNQLRAMITAHLSQAFVSIQLEKVPWRDQMLTEYIKQKKEKGILMKNKEEVNKMKRALLLSFSERFTMQMLQYSYRSEIISLYTSILSSLQTYPSVIDRYFVLGEPAGLKGKSKSEERLLNPDVRTMKRRPFLVLDDAGETLLNLWYLPHFSHILALYRELPAREMVGKLAKVLGLIRPLHDIIQYYTATVGFGKETGEEGEGEKAGVSQSAIWGGADRLATEIGELKEELDGLSDSTDITLVREHLSARRDMLYLAFDYAVRYRLKETLLAAGDDDTVKKCIESVDPELDCMFNDGVKIPAAPFMLISPVSDGLSRTEPFCQWKALLGTIGHFGLTLQSPAAGTHLNLSLFTLTNVEKQVANGEILGMSVLLEEVSKLAEDSKIAAFIEEGILGMPPRERSRHAHLPLILQKDYLLLSRLVEVAKSDWAQTKLDLHRITTSRQHKELCLEYEHHILPEAVHLMTQCLDDPFDPAHNLSVEYDIKLALLRKFVETRELGLMDSTIKSLQADTALVLAEQGREEASLPTDLWKDPSWKHNFTIKRPCLAEEFSAHFLERCSVSVTEEKDGRSGEKKSQEILTISKEKFDDCVHELTSGLLIREKLHFVSYTGYYESLLAGLSVESLHHQREWASAQSQLKECMINQDTTVSCLMGERCHQLLMEVSSLRARIQAVEEAGRRKEERLREAIRKEYEELVGALFKTLCALKAKLDDYREEIYDDIYQKVVTAAEGIDKDISTLRAKAEGKDVAENGDMTATSAHLKVIRELDTERVELSCLCLKTKVFTDWKMRSTKRKLNKQIAEVEEEVEISRRLLNETTEQCEREKGIQTEQVEALRKSLSRVSQRAADMSRRLQQEKKKLKETEYYVLQKAAHDKKLEFAKTDNSEKLLSELHEKEAIIRAMDDQHLRSRTHQQALLVDAQRNYQSASKKAQVERRLKFDAYRYLEDLQRGPSEEDVLGEVGGWSRPGTGTGGRATSGRERRGVGGAEARDHQSGEGQGSQRGSIGGVRPHTAAPSGNKMLKSRSVKSAPKLRQTMG